MRQQVWPAEAVGGLLGEQPRQEGFEGVGHGVRVRHRVPHNQLDEAVDAVGEEGGCAHSQLIQDDTQGPQIHRVRVRLLLHQLGSHVQGRPLDAGQHQRGAAHGPGKPKVAKLHRAVAPHQYVLRLHVPVDDAVGVEVVEGGDQLAGDGGHLILGQALVVFKHLKQLAAGKLGDHSELSARLKGVTHVDDVLVLQVDEVAGVSRLASGKQHAGTRLQGTQDLNLLAQRPDVFLALAVLHDEFDSLRAWGREG